ncbi:MAG: asparagine synthetase B, partial [Pseudomonadota bacterium]
MCGIAGVIDASAGAGPESEARLRGMAATLRHRGPDGEGVWLENESLGLVGLTQTRLAIIDLSDAGKQPMLSACGRFAMVYNGEAYNAEDLRAALGEDAPNWRGHSDSEAILEHWARFGPRATVDRLIGMFAIAVWDRRARTLTLARDRFGLKPLYYRAGGGLFVFGSELRALRAAGGWTPEIDRDAVA